MEITAVRHGETEENLRGIVQGQSLGTLSANGQRQILAVAKQLQHESFDAIISSDLPRCVATSAAIRQFHRQTPFHYDARLREHSMGAAEGMLFTALEKDGWFDHDITRKADGGESWQEVRDRLVQCLNDVLQHDYTRVLLVTHGGVMRCINSILAGRPLEDTIKEHYENCAVVSWQATQRVVQ